AYDPRGGVLPSWLSGWQKLAEQVGVDDSKISNMDLYSKSFGAGRVSLGGNLQAPASGSETNYFVIAKRDVKPIQALSFSPQTLAYTVVQGATVVTKTTELAASNGSPSVVLSKSEASWLTLPASNLGTLSFGPSQINSNLAPGVYKATVTATATDYTTASLQIDLTVTSATSTSQDAKINFELSSSNTPTDHVKDAGLPFDAGRRYGWVDPTTKEPSDLSNNMRERSGSEDILLRTFSQMQASNSGQVPGSWEYVVPNGVYNVTVSVGDPNYFDSKHQINVEGKAAITNFVPSQQQAFQSATVAVEVKDGKLTIDAVGGTNTKLNYVVISPTTAGVDIISPVASVSFTGTEQSANVYKNEVSIAINASDKGGSGLATVQYSLNGGTYTTYASPVRITEQGSYTIRAKATDNSGNQTITQLYSFSIVTSSKNNNYMFVENMDKFPGTDQLTFSRIQIPWRRENSDGSFTPYNSNHDKVKLRIHNKGTGALVINNLVLSNPSAWKIAQLNGIDFDKATDLPLSVSSKSYAELTVEFIAVDQATRVKVLQDMLAIYSNDDLTPYKEIQLRGLWQKQGEDKAEPHAQEIVNAFGFGTKIGFNASDGASDGDYIMPNSDEIMSAFFLRVDPSKPVSVLQMAAYHGCCSDVETFQWYNKNSTSSTVLFTHENLDGQSLLPRRNGSSKIAQGTFTPTASSSNPTAAFGLRVQRSYSDRTRNYQGKIGLRIWKAVDASGKVIPNAYLVGMDYLTSPYVNYDYQDNIYFISNVKPETGSAHYSELAAIPSAANFGTVMAGSTKSLSVSLKNMGQTYESGNDPSIQISSVEIVGPNANEFTVTQPATTLLGPQGTVNLAVSFKGVSAGIKNAAVLVHYSNASSPLRIPLYGTVNTTSTTVAILKRVKGAADTDVSIGGNVWEADKDYRFGSIKLDKQVVETPIAATDEDVLYQTYLSAASDLSETRYAIPIANGNYMLRMHFVENYFTEPGTRVFDIKIENEVKLSSFDIYSEVGYRAALVKDFEVNVTDGTLNLNFNPTVNRLAIAGLEIFKVTPTSTITSAMGAFSENSSAKDQKQTSLQLYPNPTQGGKVYMGVANFGPKETLLISVHDVLGRVVSTLEAVTDQEGNAHVELLSGNKPLERGLYIVKAKAAGGKAQAKLLIQ
ncbi:malectin domain-containing carbohydrate-binding protein, partial [Pontibacter sp. E15-1]|uniref:malectin domain-containing carbohydrate-binding protein n=1 Tax=Pontibacter sp. E15-1 TaxID=2919918 RepID=UPI001F4FB44E